MRVADLMNRRAAAIVPSATMQRAAELLVLTQASDLCVVDHDNRFLGIVSEGDLIRAAMPDFDEVIAYGASNAQTLEILLETGRSIASEPVERLIIKSPLTLAPDDSLMRAAAPGITALNMTSHTFLRALCNPDAAPSKPRSIAHKEHKQV